MNFNSVVVSFGSNINATENLKKACEILSQKFQIVRFSALLETAPIDRPEQNNYINGSVLLTTIMELSDFRKTLSDLETTLGRIRTNDKFASRTIDLDITVWNNEILDKDFYSRDFLKKSVLEVLPNLTVP